MPGFADWARKKESAVKTATIDPVVHEECYLVDNSKLNSSSNGLRYRASPAHHDLRRDLKPVPWASMVWGQPVEGGAWLQIRQGRFLPMCTAEGLEVLVHLSAGTLPEEEPKWNLDDFGKLVTELSEEAKDLEGPGTPYEVLADRVALREGPSLAALPVCRMPQGATVELFAWDDSRKWRRCREPKHGKCGWVLLDHEELGPLLRPEGQDFCALPLDPTCVAAVEGRLCDLRRFMAETTPSELEKTADVLGCGPLMLAAEKEHLECCFCLLQAGADADVALKQAANRERDLTPRVRAILRVMAGESIAMLGLPRQLQKTLQELLSSRGTFEEEDVLGGSLPSQTE